MIVESPKKARTIERILGGGYRVEASFGHVRDLPPRQLGVDVTGGFEPTYVPVPRARERLSRLREAARAAGSVYLATDPDREGEAIAWHLVASLGFRPGEYSRVAFHEITPRAVREALAHPRAIDERLVDAQQARRVLDRLVGYQVSPLLWRKIQRGTSAGRVQSVALRLVVEREAEIQAFVAEEYWTIAATLSPVDRPRERFTAGLVELEGEKPRILDQAAAESVVAWLKAVSTTYTILGFERKPRENAPPPPFTTSTLQQAAANRLRLPAKRTMALAQSLYEDGLITYHRTDSVQVAPEAIAAARKVIAEHFGADHLPERARHYASRQKNAQEAHEAVRPTDPARLPDRAAGGPEGRLYELIWQRFLASQMAPARYLVDTARVAAAHPVHSAILVARASVLIFPGYLAVYGITEGVEEGDDEPAPRGEQEEEELPRNRRLPELRPGEALTLHDVAATQRFTKPPPRYTEASLVRALESLGVGRPSTYAAILSTLEERAYVVLGPPPAARGPAVAGEDDARRRGARRVFIPTALGVAANGFLCRHFPTVVDPEFTARMEEGLDEVARGETAWRDLLARFYGPFSAALAAAGGAEKVDVADQVPSPQPPSKGRGRRSAATPTGETCPRCGKPLLLRISRHGPFLGCSGYPRCDYTRDAASVTGASPRRSPGRRGQRGEPSDGVAAGPAVDGAPSPQPSAGGRKRGGGRARPPGSAARPPAGDDTIAPSAPASRAEARPPDDGDGSSSAPKCPRCGKPLVRRTQWSTGLGFLGCSSYPACRYTRSLPGG